MKKLGAIKAFVVGITLLAAVGAQAQTQLAAARWVPEVAASPAGDWLVIRSAGALWWVEGGGGEARAIVQGLAHVERPVVNAAGTLIAFAGYVEGNADLHVVSPEGGAIRRLTWHSAHDWPTAFSPDGAWLYFRSARLDAASNVQFPSGRMPELYRVRLADGRIEQVLTTPAERARPVGNSSVWIYEDIKGSESTQRKRHRSAIARDLWTVDFATGAHVQRTQFRGEDRDAHVLADGKTVLFLSERGGSFNVWRGALDALEASEPVTAHTEHPVRSLTVSADGTAWYSHAGAIWRLRADAAPERLAIHLRTIAPHTARERGPLAKEISEFALSPNGDEIAVIARGDVWVLSAEHGTARRLTQTTGMERDLSWHPEGKALVYAADRDAQWGLYALSIDEDEPYFYDALEVTERRLSAHGVRQTQPRHSPDGEWIAFMEGLTELRVYNLKSGETRNILETAGLWRYTDDTNQYSWSPDSRNLLVSINPNAGSTEIGLLALERPGEWFNLTENAFYDEGPRWILGGKGYMWLSDREGRRDFRGRNAESAVWVQFLDRAAYERFTLSKGRLAALEAREKAVEKAKADDAPAPEAAEQDEGKAAAEPEAKEAVAPLEFALEHRARRTMALSTQPGDIALPILSEDGETLYYFASGKSGYDLWKLERREGKNKRLAALGLKLDWGSRSAAANSLRLQMGPKEKHLYLLNEGALMKIDTQSGERESIAFDATGDWDRRAELRYELRHVQRVMNERFYEPGLHGVDFDRYADFYAELLAGVETDREFGELLSELLGELNVSHTGAYYRGRGGIRTASLGFYPDWEWRGEGIRVAEVLVGGPLERASVDVRAGEILLALDGTPLQHMEQLHRLLNGRADALVVLRVRASDGAERSVRAYPVGLGAVDELVYQRWVERRRAAVEALSAGRLGYVHIRGMDDEGFRQVYAEALRLDDTVEGLVIDTRFNGGGFLHDELVRFFDAQRYYTYEVRGRLLGYEPSERWAKPQIMLMSESNYSNAYMVPQVFQDLGLGKVVGMPVAGTGTAVWWKDLPYSPLLFGIPQMGIRDIEGDYLENKEIFPDIMVDNPPAEVARGQDAMLETAVRSLLAELD